MARILVIEDEPGIALALKNELTMEGYAVEVVSDGETALERARAETFDLILLDILLPKKDGYTVCRELRRSENRTPVLMLTAKTHEAEKVLGLELGADDYVTKPFSAPELRARIRALLRRGSGSTSEIYRFGDVEVDFTKAEVRRNRIPVETTALEFKLLSNFVHRRGHILTRDQLLDQVWGSASSPSDRVIDNHIMNLRRKIEADPREPRYLVNIRGLGYRFDG